MKNLENLNVKELSLEEQKDIEGGALFAFLAVIFVLSALWAIID